MKCWAPILLSATLLGTSALADEKSDKQAFRDAYKAYQVAFSEGRRPEALDHARTAYEYGEKIYGPDHKNTAALLLNYGRLVYRNEEARELLQDAVKRYEKLYGKDSAEIIDPLMDLAANSAGIGTLGKARSLYNRALKLAETHYAGEALVEGQIRLEMGKIALQEAAAREALRHLNRARELFAQIKQPGIKTKMAEVDFYIGKFMMAKQDYKKAEQSLLSSLAVYEEIAPNNQVTMSNHAFLIRVYEEQGKSDEATKHCRAIGSKSPRKLDQDYDPIYQVSPIYPQSAQRSGSEGYAIVELTVDKNGFVKKPTIVERKGHKGFEKASLDAATKFRYAPRYENGKAVDTNGVRYRFTYNLR